MATSEEFRERLYLFALERTQREGQDHEQWIEQALLLLPILAAGLHGASVELDVPAPPRKSQTLVSGESTTTIQQPPAAASGFGPAFSGWPQAELRGILVAAQEAVLARIYGSDEAKHEETRQRYLAALDSLEKAKREQQTQ